MTDRLRALWDFDDLEVTRARLREELARASEDAVRAEVLTQLARVEGLRGDFDAGERLIEEAVGLAGDSAAASVRVNLERGRLRRSSGDPEAALPLFETAFQEAIAAGEYFHAADAAHMVALVAPDRPAFLEWTTRGIELAERHEEARSWLGSMLNNLGWEHFEHGEHEAALDAFERALRARERDATDPEATEIARYAVGKALRTLGRSQEAVPLLQHAVAWAGDRGEPDGWFHEELAEDYAALGREGEAREQARLAVGLLAEADPSFTGERAARLRGLAAE